MDLFDYFRFAAALIFVLGLIGGLAFVTQRFKLVERWSNLSPGGDRRLKVIESLALDPRRRLIIIRRDDTEHLLVLGANGETVVETDIQRPAGNALAPLALESIRDELVDAKKVIASRARGGAA